MSFSVNSTTTGMDNKGINLYNKAVELAKNGQLNEKGVENLEKIANSDGNYTGKERVFINDLKNSDNRDVFEAISKQSKYDPSSFNWEIDNPKTSVTSANGHNIELEFSDDPSPAKQIKGDIEEAKNNIDKLLPNNKKSEWENLDKNNVSKVKNFIDSLKLKTDDKVNFVQNYMTANFNHPGIDINWGGANLQEGINAVPTDENGRKYLDCEAYSKLAENLLAKNKSFTTLEVASGANGNKRDHQVSIHREGKDAYVISNNEIKKVPNGASKNNQDLVKDTFPDFKNIIEDKNGAMKADTGTYSVGDELTQDNGSKIKISSIDSATKMSGIIDDSNGNKFNVDVRIDESNGNFKSIPNFKTGDKMKTPDGTLDVVNSSNGKYEATLDDNNGSKYHVNLSVDKNDGSYKYIPDFKSGDKVKTSTGIEINFTDNNKGFAMINGVKQNVTASVNKQTGQVSFR
ncbi:MAG: hypothetical protein U0457_21650 [Candidatus Sericytochromatia bacterium]